MKERIEITDIIGKDAHLYFNKGQIISFKKKDGSMDAYRIVKMKHKRTWVTPFGIFPSENVKVMNKLPVCEEVTWKDNTK